MATGQLKPTCFPDRFPRLEGVPVFLYHGITASAGSQFPFRERKYWVHGLQFCDHLCLIHMDTYRVKPLPELWSAPNRLRDGKRRAAITFDDGLESHYQVAFPLLLEIGLRADFFVNTADIGRRGYLTWRQVAEMQRAGMSFQSHGHEHVDLSRLSARALENELRNSKRLLEDRLGSEVEFLAAPYGLLSRQVVEVARAVGYRAVCSSRSWPARPGASTLNRIAVYRHTGPGEFRALLMGNPVPYFGRAVGAIARNIPRRILLRWRPELLGVRVLEKQA